jgi:hypothetical protein
LAKSLSVCYGSQASTANTTQYWDTFNGLLTAGVSATETDFQNLFRIAGTLSNLWIRLTANSIAATTTIRSRKNAANGNMSVSVGSSATGTFTDATNTDAIAAGDKIALQSVPGAATGTFTMTINAFVFKASDITTTITKITAGVLLNQTTLSQTLFIPIGGNYFNRSTTEATNKLRQRKAGTYKNLAVYIKTNTGAVTTFTSRKNGANGNMTISITASTTGFFEDTTHTDAVVAGDDYCYTFISGGSATACFLQTCQVDFSSTAMDTLMAVIDVNAATGLTQNKTITNYWGPGGDLALPTTTEANTQTLANVHFNLSELTANIVTNSITAASTLTMRSNTAATALTASITASTTGVFSDSTHTVTVHPADLINYQLVTGTGTGTTSLAVNTISVYATSVTVPQTVWVEWEET